jgi:hypothetical protein
MLGILDTRNFYASHILYLNDSSEYLGTFERIFDLIRRFPQLRDYAAEAPDLVAAWQLSFFRDDRNMNRAVFVASFPLNGMT